MAYWASAANVTAFNTGAGWLSNLKTQGGNRAPYTGNPGYSKRADRATILPAAPPFYMSIYENAVIQLYCAGLGWTGSRDGTQNGWWAPDILGAANSVTSYSISGAHAIVNMGGQTCKVTGLYSGGTTGGYYGTGNPAVLERIRLESITGRTVSIVGTGAISNASVLGTYNPSFIGAGGSMDLTGVTMVYVIGTNR